MNYLSVVVLATFCFMSAACEKKPEQTVEDVSSSSTGSAATVATGSSGFGSVTSSNSGSAEGTSTGGNAGNASSEESIVTGEGAADTASADADADAENTAAAEEDVAATEAEEDKKANTANAFVGFSSNSVDIADGANFTLDVKANLSAVSEGGGISLRYDPSILEVVTVNVDASVWEFSAQNGQINNSEGFVLDILFNSFKGASGEAKIATIEFKSINKGSSSLTIEQSQLNPFASKGEVMTVSFGTAYVVVN